MNECCIKLYLQQPMISHALKYISNSPAVSGLQTLSKMNENPLATRTSQSVFEYLYWIVCTLRFVLFNVEDDGNFRFLHILLALKPRNTPDFVPLRKCPDAGISLPITKRFFYVSDRFLSISWPKTPECRRARSKDHGSLSGKSALERPLLFLRKM